MAGTVVRFIHLSIRHAVSLAGAWLLVLTLVLAYRYVTRGGMGARQTPSALETFVGHELVELGIPREARDATSPLDARGQGADLLAGRELYLANCQTCHGSDGTGKTAAGVGLYPPPRDLSRTALEDRKRTDGELFYLVKNGVRNTGMPAWPLEDRQIWELVAFLRSLPQTAAEGRDPENVTAKSAYVGSLACKGCHGAIYDRWIKTPMA
ncbi:MAG TPA: c-type cytochrome, partial [Polyangiaceae bacterium]